MAGSVKSDAAFRTIGEVSGELGIAQHVLRYWETRFPQLRPVQRSGNRRYYRPEDVALVRRIRTLLDEEGYTVRGVQQLLARRDPPTPDPVPSVPAQTDDGTLAELRALRELLAAALTEA